MISTYQRLKRQRDAGEINGFTLIELLIVIVVLGIWPQSSSSPLVASPARARLPHARLRSDRIDGHCCARGAVPGTTLSSAVLTTGTNGSGPYIQSWPNNSAHYSFTVSGSSTAV